MRNNPIHLCASHSEISEVPPGLYQGKSWVELALEGNTPGTWQAWEKLSSLPSTPLIEKSALENRLGWLSCMSMLGASDILDSDRRLREDLRGIMSIHCGTMMRGGVSGVRNAMRLGIDHKEFARMEAMAHEYINYIHPLTPLINLPNLLASELCMQLMIENENSVYFSESSGAMAFMDACRTLRCKASELALVVSGHGFGPHMLELIMANWEILNAEFTQSSWFPAEAGISLLLGTEAGIRKAGLTPLMQIDSIGLGQKGGDYLWQGVSNGPDPICAKSLYDVCKARDFTVDSFSTVCQHLDGIKLEINWKRPGSHEQSN
ncbi:MAG: hypothetical protein H3C47_08430 [Candidatus Cloacimonetes bacterium]|nr:hypothetical protein [Candidatus Cloacimonadota bacterium]